MAKASLIERPYESLFICPSETSQKALDEFNEKVKKTIVDTNGVVRSVQSWGRRRLTYPIKHHREGTYVYVDFNGSNTSAEALNTLFRVSDVVLRHLTVERVDVVKEVPKIEGVAGAEAVVPADAIPAPVTQTEAPSATKEA